MLSLIDKICEAFSGILKGVYHERIEYPQVRHYAGQPIPETAPAPAEPAPAAPAPETQAPAEAPAAPVDAAPAAPPAAEISSPAPRPISLQMQWIVSPTASSMRRGC